MPKALCSKCEKNEMVECLECGMEALVGCNCYWTDSPESTANLYCHSCSLLIEIEVGEFLGDHKHHPSMTDITCLTDEDLQSMEDNSQLSLYDWVQTEEAGVALSAPSVYDLDSDWTGYDIVQKCRHSQLDIEFPSGVEVYASSYCYSNQGRKPDFGLYLDDIWPSPGFAYFIEWADYGLPHESEWDDALMVISDVYKKARNGLFVEVGCIGGHGRTGTTLAIMAVLDGLDAASAIKYVRKNYCKEAIEGKKQEWFVHYAHAFYNSGATPEFPGENYYWEIKEVFDWEAFDINNQALTITEE